MGIDVNSLVCKNCGAPLVIPDNCNGRVFCASCGTQCIISGLNLNSEVTAKENINSGIGFKTNPKEISNVIADFFFHAEYMPIDVFDETVITSVKKFMVPAYLFHCNSMATYTYEDGIAKTRQVVKTTKDGKAVVRNQNYTDWVRNSEVASVNRYVAVVGNKEYGEVADNVYGEIDPSNLTDIEYLEIPADCKTLKFNIPSAAAFRTTAEPLLKDALEAEAMSNLLGRNYRYFKMGQSSVQKDEEIRVLLSLVAADFTYKNYSGTAYIGGAGKAFVTGDPPEDYDRRASEMQYIEERKKIKSKDTPYLIGGLIFLALAIMTAFVFPEGTIVSVFLLMPPAGFFLYRAHKLSKQIKQQRAEADAKIKSVKGEQEQIYKAFKQSSGTLNGL